MENETLQTQLRSIHDAFFNCASQTTGDECQAHWGRYMCVIVAGFLENALFQVWRDYFDCTNRSQVKVPSEQNPKADAFLERARKYNQTWAEEFETYMNDNGRGLAIDSVMTNRHQIAHGGYSNISLQQVVNDYLPKCIEVVEYMESALLRQVVGA